MIGLIVLFLGPRGLATAKKREQVNNSSLTLCPSQIDH